MYQDHYYPNIDDDKREENRLHSGKFPRPLFQLEVIAYCVFPEISGNSNPSLNLDQSTALTCCANLRCATAM